PVTPARIAGRPENIGVGAKVESIVDVRPHGDQDICGDHAALRQSGRAGGVDDRGRLIARIASRYTLRVVACGYPVVVDVVLVLRTADADDRKTVARGH